MDWIPDWFRVSAEFTYALVAFLGSVAILHWERYLGRRDLKRLREVQKWELLQAEIMNAMDMFGRSQNHLRHDNVAEYFNDLGELSVVHNRLGSLMIVAPDDFYEKISLKALQTVEQFTDEIRQHDNDMDSSSLVETIKQLMGRVSMRTIELHMDMTFSVRQKLVMKWKRRQYRRATIVASQDGDTPPAAT